VQSFAFEKSYFVLLEMPLKIVIPPHSYLDVTDLRHSPFNDIPYSKDAVLQKSDKPGLGYKNWSWHGFVTISIYNHNGVETKYEPNQSSTSTQSKKSFR
jgi:hypothetical protein